MHQTASASAETSHSPAASGWRLEHTYAQLPAVFHVPVAPTPVRAPRLVVLNRPLAESVGVGAGAPAGGGRFDVQLKGPGLTPYSRRGDGRAALGPMLREYIVSEAMHALRIPTTRSLAVAATGEPVWRQQGALPGAVLTRVAASHIRVGTFQWAAAAGDEAA